MGSGASDESDAETLDKQVENDQDHFVAPSLNNSTNKAYQQASKLLTNQKKVDPAPLLSNTTSSTDEEADFPTISNKERVAEAKRKNRPRSTAQNPPPRTQPPAAQSAPKK